MDNNSRNITAGQSFIPKPLAVIPARGGSKGIPRKNIKLLNGRPLIDYTISVARQLMPDNRIILSSEDSEIISVAEQCGLPVSYSRPAHLATDSSSTQDVLIDAMNWADNQGIDYNVVLLLQPTSPLRTAEDVKNCLRAYSPEIDMAVTVMPSKCNPYYDCFETGTDGYLAISKGSGTYTRRQDAPTAWQLNGAVYAINPESLRREPIGRFKRRLAVPMDAEKSIDLDSMLDWKIAEILISSIKES